MLRPVEELERILKLHEVPVSEADAKSTGKALAGMIQVYKEAVEQDGIDMFLNESPITRISTENWAENKGMFTDLACWMNYHFSTNPKSKVNVRAYLKEERLQEAAHFLDSCIQTARNLDTPDNEILQNARPVFQQLCAVRLGEDYENWKAMLDTNLDDALVNAEQYVNGVFQIMGGTEKTRKAANAIFTVRKKDAIEEDINAKLGAADFDGALEMLANYRDAALEVYDGLGGNRDSLRAAGKEMWEEVKEAIKVFGECTAALSTIEVDEKHPGKAEEEAREPREKLQEAANTIVSNIQGYKTVVDELIDENKDEKAYKSLVKDVVDRSFKEGLVALEHQVMEMIHKSDAEERANKCVDAVRKTWPYMTRTYNPEKVEKGTSNYGFIKILNNKDECAEILKNRAEYLLSAESGEASEGEDVEVAEKAQEILDLAVPKSRRIKGMDASNPEYLMVVEEMIRNAKDSQYTRQFAYMEAEKSMKLFGKVAGDVRSALKSSLIKDDESREEARDRALRTALVERFGFFKDGDNPAAKPFESYEMLFPYAAVFHPAEKIGANGMPDIKTDIGADMDALKKGKSEDYSLRHPKRAWILSVFGLN